MKAIRPRLTPLTRPLRQTTLRAPFTPSSRHRTFVPNPFASALSPQTLTASRTLPYPSAAIYNIIADVSQYSSFLPYCQSSTVTRWSAPDASNKRWPSEAKLVVGWAGITEEFHSKIYCVPGRVVEAVGGASQTTLGEEDIRHHREVAETTGSNGDAARPASSEDLLTHLLTRWTVRPFPYKPPPSSSSSSSSNSSSTTTTTNTKSSNPLGSTLQPPQDQTEVSLAIEFQFANPIYSTLSAGAAPKVAEMMIRAFEERVKSVLEK